MNAASPPGHRLVYHLCRDADWREGRRSGGYVAPSLMTEGFIHFSTAAQLPASAARHQRGISGLVLLAVDVIALGQALRWEPSRGGALFPHLYAPLPPGAVRTVTAVALGADGIPLLPLLADDGEHA